MINKQVLRFALSSALAATFLLSVGYSTFADDRAECNKRLDSDRARIDRDAKRHGNDSPQVSKDVARMDNDRSWCRDHHADWDHSRFDVGIYIKH